MPRVPAWRVRNKVARFSTWPLAPRRGLGAKVGGFRTHMTNGIELTDMASWGTLAAMGKAWRSP